MIVLRTANIDLQLEMFAKSLETASGELVAFAVDERNGPASTRAEKVGITKDEVNSLGLYAPHDFAWSCGDYCLYLARQRWPNASHFWLIENDVRISGNASRFFHAMRGRNHDILLAHFRPADRNWWWHKSARGRGIKVYRCLFPIGRYSSEAVDMLLEKRRIQSRSLLRRLLWPNDEAFVATTMANSNFLTSDINATADEFYSDDTLTYNKTISENVVLGDSSAEPRIFHPVLNQDQIEKKKLRNIKQSSHSIMRLSLMRRFLGNINRLLSW